MNFMVNSFLCYENIKANQSYLATSAPVTNAMMCTAKGVNNDVNTYFLQK